MTGAIKDDCVFIFNVAIQICNSLGEHEQNFAVYFESANFGTMNNDNLSDIYLLKFVFQYLYIIFDIEN